MLGRPCTPSLVLVVAGALSVAGAAAGAEPSTVWLDYRAPSECPGARHFLDDVGMRATRAPIAPAASPGEAERRIAVSIAQANGEYDGELTIVEKSGETEHRSVAGASCETVVAALSLVAALAVDPSAANGVVPPPPSNAPAVVAPAAAPEPPPLPLPARPTPQDASALPPSRVPAGGDRASARRASSVHLGAGANVGVAGLSAPGAVFVPFGFGDVAIDRPGLLAPSFRLGFARGAGDTIATSSGSASFTWSVGRAQVCPVRLRFASVFDARPCADVEAGVLAAQGTAVSHARSPDRAWVATGLDVRLEWIPTPAVHVELGGGVGVPLVRDTFVFEPAPRVYQAPSVYPSAGAGLVAYFL
jgi:hypothetical protein